MTPNQTLIDALRPFAARAGKLDGKWLGHETNWSPAYGGTEVTIADLRRAAATLSLLEQEGEAGVPSQNVGLAGVCDLSAELRTFAMNMRRDDADARSDSLRFYYEAIEGFADQFAALATPPASMKGDKERDVLTKRIAEVVEEDGGCWRACSGCQESVDGCVSFRDYPRSSIFKCQPGSGCRECGGLGVIWDDGEFLRGYGEALSTPASPPSSKPECNLGLGCPCAICTEARASKPIEGGEEIATIGSHYGNGGMFDQGVKSGEGGDEGQ